MKTALSVTLLVACIAITVSGYKVELKSGAFTPVEVTKYRLPEISFTVSNKEPQKGLVLSGDSEASELTKATWLISDEGFPKDKAHAKWTVTSDPKTGKFVWTVPACEFTTWARLPESVTFFMTLDVTASPPPTTTEVVEMILHHGNTQIELAESPSKVQMVDFETPVCAPDNALIVRVPKKAEAAGSQVEVSLDLAHSLVPFEFDTVEIGVYQGPTAFTCPESVKSYKQEEWVKAKPLVQSLYHGLVITFTQAAAPGHHCPTVPVSLAMTAGTKSD